MWNFRFFAFGHVNIRECMSLTLNGMSMKRKEWSSSLCRALNSSELAKCLWELICPYHLQSRKATLGFFEASFSWPCFVGSLLGPLGVSNAYLAGHIQVIYICDYYLHMWLGFVTFQGKSYMIHEPESSVMTRGRLRAWLLLFVRKDWGFLKLITVTMKSVKSSDIWHLRKGGSN